MKYKEDQRATREALKPKIIRSNRTNRKTKRRRFIDRTYTRRGYAFGNKIGGKTLNIAEHQARKFEV